MLDSQLRIAVIGDVMVDVDLHCVCNRICQDGPWPVFSVVKKDTRPGGAANVHRMLGALDCNSIIVGYTEDPSIKSRVFVDGKLHGPRIDVDCNRVPSDEVVKLWIDIVKKFKPDGIIVADHGKGAITPHLMHELSILRVPVFVDPVMSTPFLTDSHSLFAIIGGTNELSKQAYAKGMHGTIIIEKLGPDGVNWFNHSTHYPSYVNGDVVDTLGAGDQFIAAFAYALLLGPKLDVGAAIKFANTAAAIQCKRKGCTPVTHDEVCHQRSGTKLFRR